MPKGPRPPLMDAAEADYTTRARGISSVSRTMSDIDRRSQQAANTLSSDVSSLSRRQKSIEDRLRDVESYTPAEKDMKATSSSILRNVNLAMITLASGMKKITMTTAGALKEAVGDYGRAISEDFSINKQNLTAMALSKISPVFGYFVSKFMQTDVYRKAIDKIKDSMSSALSAIGTKVKGWFHIGGGKSPDEAIDRLTKKMPKRPKKMQVGGYVSRGGLAQVHAAEVIMPIDKVIDRFSGGNEIQQQMLTSLEDLNIHMRTFSDSYRKDIMHRKGLVGDFLRSLISGEYGRSWEMQMLFLQKEIRNAIVDQSKNAAQRINEAMEVTMRRHPTFRAIVRFTNWTTRFGKFLMWSMPFKAPYRAIKWSFGKRDQYSAPLDKALTGKSSFVRIENILSLIYTAMAPNLERVASYLNSVGENIYKLTDKMLPGQGVKPVYTVRSWTRARAFARGIGAPFQLGAAAYRKIKGGLLGGIERAKLSGTKALVPSNVEMEEYEGTYMTKKEATKLRLKKEKSKTSVVYQMKELIKIRKASEKTADNTSSMMGRLKKFGSDILFYLGIFWNVISSALSAIPGVGSIMRGIGSVGSLAKGAAGGIWSAGKFVLTKIIGPVISSLGSWITGLLSSVGLTGLSATLGTSLSGLAAGGLAGIGTILIGSLAAGIIGYAIGWAVNKGIDWLFGEEGGLGSWVYDKLNPVIENKRVSLIDQAWEQMKGWANQVVGYVVWPFQKMSELTRIGIDWIWENVQKIPGISKLIEWGTGAYHGTKDWLTTPEDTGEWGVGKSPSEKAKEWALGKKKEVLDAAEFTKEFSASALQLGIWELQEKYIRATDPKTKEAIYNKIMKLKDEYQSRTTNKVRELKQKGIDITAEQKAAIDAKLAENEQIINQIRESTSSFGERVKEGYNNVQRSVVSTVNNITNSSTNNNNNMGPSESRFISFGSGDKMALRVLEANPVG